MSFTISSVPSEIGAHIFSFLDDNSLIASSSASTDLQAAANYVFYDRCQKYLTARGEPTYSSYDNSQNYKKRYFFLITNDSNVEHYYKIQAIVAEYTKLLDKHRHYVTYKQDLQKCPLRVDSNVEWRFNDTSHPYDENVRYKKIYDTLMEKDKPYAGYTDCAMLDYTLPLRERLDSCKENVICWAKLAIKPFTCPGEIFAQVALTSVDAVQISIHNQHRLDHTLCDCTMCFNARDAELATVANRRWSFHPRQYGSDGYSWSD